jgi:YVTN family beta-propeller protein
VPNQGSGTVSVVDLATRTVVREIAVGAAPFGLAFSTDGRFAYVGTTDALSVVDTVALTVTRTIPLGGAPAGMAMAPDGHVLYVTAASGGVLPVDPATGSVGAPIPTGAGAYDVEFSADGATAWVVDTGSNDVRPVDVATGRAGTAVTVGAVPDGVGLTRR